MLKKLFTNDKFFAISTFCSAFSLAVLGIIYAIQYSDGMFGSGVIKIVGSIYLVVLYISYKRHEKNVLKGIMGATLSTMLISALYVIPMITLPAEKVIIPLNAVLSALLLTNHFVINSSRKSSPTNIRLNQVLVLLIAINLIAWSVVWFPYSLTATDIIADVCAIVGFAFMAASIVCVESRLDAYRLDREEAGWTEEAGYPEGYVHQKDR